MAGLPLGSDPFRATAIAGLPQSTVVDYFTVGEQPRMKDRSATSCRCSQGAIEVLHDVGTVGVEQRSSE